MRCNQFEFLASACKVGRSKAARRFERFVDQRLLKKKKYMVENYKRDGKRMIAESTRESTEMIEPRAQALSRDGATIFAIDAALAVTHGS